MIGIVIQLILSWLLLWIFYKRNLSALGLTPTKERLTNFIIFFLITAALCSTGFLIKIYWGEQHWSLNPELSGSMIFEGVWWNIKSVLFEELIFRGALLYILIKKMGSSRAIIISSIAFGIYHWFSFGIIGSLIPMTVVFIMTGAMGILLAYAYWKRLSLYIPIAIHLGWNITQIFIFSQGPLGKGVFITEGTKKFETGSYLIFFASTFLPIILVFLINYLLLNRQKQTNINS